MKPIVAAPIAIAIAWQLLITRLAPKLGLMKLNFRKTPIMGSYGLISFPYMAAAMISLALLDLARWHKVILFIWVMGAMWVLGAIDDIWGSREVGGFKGHFRKLLFERKLTTGAVKALGGGVVGIAAGWAVSDGHPLKWALGAILIPLAANLLNLLDLRPGRAVAVFFAGMGVTCIVALGSLSEPWVIAAIAVIAFFWGIDDSRGRAMMGDSGSNSLGAALGLSIALNSGPIFQAAAVACIVLVHWYSEKHSITGLIESNRVLRRIDGLLGVR